MPPPNESWMNWLEKLGLPLFLLLLLVVAIGYGVRGAWRWAEPHMDAWLVARIDREKAMADSIRVMTDKIVEITTATANSVLEMKAKVPGICKFKKGR